MFENFKSQNLSHSVASLSTDVQREVWEFRHVKLMSSGQSGTSEETYYGKRQAHSIIVLLNK
jgi:hypothetical protein